MVPTERHGLLSSTTRIYPKGIFCSKTSRVSVSTPFRMIAWYCVANIMIIYQYIYISYSLQNKLTHVPLPSITAITTAMHCQWPSAQLSSGSAGHFGIRHLSEGAPNRRTGGCMEFLMLGWRGNSPVNSCWQNNSVSVRLQNYYGMPPTFDPCEQI